MICALLFHGSAQAAITVTVDNVGLQTLTYNGQNYISGAATLIANPGVVIASALFRAPDGTNKVYGWGNNTLNRHLLFLPGMLSRARVLIPRFSSIFIFKGNPIA